MQACKQASKPAREPASPLRPAPPAPPGPARLTHREASTAGSLPLKAPPVRAASCPCTTTAIICRYSSCVFAHAQPLFEDLDVKSSLHHTFFITILTCIICPSLRKSVDWRKKERFSHSFLPMPMLRDIHLRFRHCGECGACNCHVLAVAGAPVEHLSMDVLSTAVNSPR